MNPLPKPTPQGASGAKWKKTRANLNAEEKVKGRAKPTAATPKRSTLPTFP